MKKTLWIAILALVLSVILAPPVMAQTDASTWFKMRDGEVTVIPWYVYNSDKIFVDARYNFDAGDSASVFLGKSYGDKVKFIPAVGAIGGKYFGLSAELNIVGKLGKVEYFVMNQYSLGLGGKADFAYHWIDLMIPVSKRVSVGFDEQLYCEKGSKGEFDYGPVIKFKDSKNRFIKVWYAFSTGDFDKTFFGIGQSF